MGRREELTDEQWAIIKSLIPPVPRRQDGGGRPWRDNREVLNGILWILRSGARWKDLPERFPPYQTCHRRFQQWVRDGTLKRMLETLAEDLRTRGELDLSECFIDGTFAVADGSGLPVSIHAASARVHEVSLVQETLDQSFTYQWLEHLIGDKAYDSDPLDEQLAQEGIQMIALYRDNRTKASTQDGRSLRRYRRRWRIERLFAWLQNYRRLIARHDYKIENLVGFVHLGCILILPKSYL
jgi:transposase